jgi:hypothetical protein
MEKLVLRHEAGLASALSKGERETLIALLVRLYEGREPALQRRLTKRSGRSQG